jgi:hypothetical protein
LSAGARPGASYGFQPGSDAFAECVQQDQDLHKLIAAQRRAAAAAALLASPMPNFAPAPQSGQPVISSGDCIGAVVNGVCHGTPAPGAPMAICHGQMVAGVCTGPMF